MGFAMKLDVFFLCSFLLLVHGAPLVQPGHLAIHTRQRQSVARARPHSKYSFTAMSIAFDLGTTKGGRKEEEKEVVIIFIHEKNATSDCSFGHAQLV